MAINSPQNQLTNPFSLNPEEGYFWLKGNVHCHTTNSDGRTTPQERLDGYIARGYDFCCISDHHKITWIESLTYPDEFVLIQGVELHPENPFGGQKHHFLALNIQQDMDAARMPPQNVIVEVKRQGGSIWLAHPYWSSINIMRDTLPLHGLAGLEVFNTTCDYMGRGESSVHWDDWMALENRLYPALATDDAHAHDSEALDTYQGWTMVRVKERSVEAIMAALEAGASYSSTGPEIHDIRLRRVDQPGDRRRLVEATLRCSEAQRVMAVCDVYGVSYQQPGRKTFAETTFTLRPDVRWVRFEVIDPDGFKAWSNPFDLTSLEQA
jgi:hypothetical protein